MFLMNRVLAPKCMATSTLRQGVRAGITSTQVAFFSEEVKAAPVEEPTPAEVEANKEEWGIKYDDECLKFEKEWQIIAEKVQTE